jgi:hypothetical protein
MRNNANNLIDHHRQLANIKNLKDAKKLWKQILKIDTKLFPDYENFHSSDNDLENLITITLPSRLSKNYIHYGMESVDDIAWEHIFKLVQYYLDAPKWLQINFCKDSTRQGLDENIQRDILNDTFGDEVFTKCKPVTYVYGSRLIDKKTYTNCLKDDVSDIYGDVIPKITFKRKDIDTMGSLNGNNFWVFQKYCKHGGGHGDNVKIETMHFINDADDYVDRNKDNNYFIAQLDGESLNSEDFNIRNTDRVIVGSTEEIIELIKEL